MLLAARRGMTVAGYTSRGRARRRISPAPACRRRRRRVLDTARARVALAAAGGVPAEERLRAERRLGRREVAAELALRRLHVGVPDLRRERGAGHVGAVIEPQHLR